MTSAKQFYRTDQDGNYIPNYFPYKTAPTRSKTPELVRIIAAGIITVVAAFLVIFLTSF